MVPLYILGFLRRFGPMHGYQLKKRLGEQLSDFTDIKLPTIYYHLEKLAAAGYVSRTAEKPGTRPEKTVYSVTESGVARFKELLLRQLNFSYRPTFSADGAFYFSDDLDPAALILRLGEYAVKLDAALRRIEAHRDETIPRVPQKTRAEVRIIFDHHARHYAAERDWARASAALLRERSST